MANSHDPHRPWAGSEQEKNRGGAKKKAAAKADNDTSMPFAKSNCYLTSTRTPLMIRWPGHVKPGTVDSKNFVCTIDLMPTILEALGVKAPDGMDGRSILPILRGEDPSDRDHVF